MKKKKDDQARPPKIRRTWKIKPYTRVHPSQKGYDRHKLQADDERDIAEALARSGSEGKAGNSSAGSGETVAPEFRFCARCGGPLRSKLMGERRRLVCSQCGEILYRNPIPAVAAIIPWGGRIVLVHRAEEPRRGEWCLPAGFLELDETPEECAVRETHEETGLDIRVTDLFGIDIGRDDPRARVVLIVYLAELLGGKMRAGDDASQVGWFGPEDLPERIAFATHRRAIANYFGDRHQGDRLQGNRHEQNIGP
jgi:ADP-ribose pyrophosphatase YjhB (NUDIX family)